MTQREFIEQVGEHGPSLKDVVTAGFRAYHSQYEKNLPIHSTVARAALIHDHIVDEAKRVLSPLGFHFVRSGQRDWFNFGDRVLLQFKKLGRDCRPQNYPTVTAVLFEETGEAPSLPGILGSLPLITVGYIPKRYFEGIEGVFATRVVRRRPDWVCRLDGGVEETAILPFGGEHGAESGTGRRSRVRRVGGGDSRRVSAG
jgi:hypothetical protein